MIEQLRQRLQALQKPAGLESGPAVLPLGIDAIDAALGGGLWRGALHEVAAPGEAHLAAAAGFVLGLAALASTMRVIGSSSSLPPGERESGRMRGTVGKENGRGILWIAEDMALSESGALYGPGLDVFGIAPERLLTVGAARRHDLLWAMEEALHCRGIGAVIGELRHGAVDPVAVRRLSLAAADSGALALLLRAQPTSEASTAATRWIVGASPAVIPENGGGERKGYGPGPPRFAAHLVRNRRGPTGSWILEWSDTDERFVLATHAQPVAEPLRHRPRQKVA